MAWLHDALEEFHKLPKGGQIGVVVAFVGIAGIGYYEYRKNQSASSSASAQSANGVGIPSGASGSSPFDVQSLAEALAGFMNTGQASAPPSSPTPPPTDTPTGGPRHGGPVSLLPAGSAIWGGGPSGLVNGQFQRYWFTNSQGQQQLLTARTGADLNGFTPFLPVGTTISQTGGAWYYTTPGGSTKLLSGAATGGGGQLKHTEMQSPRIAIQERVAQRYIVHPSGAMYVQKYKVS